MKKHSIISIFIVLIFFISSYARDQKGGFMISKLPWGLTSDAMSFTVGGDADLSPVPSEIVYSDINLKSTFSIGGFYKADKVDSYTKTAFEPMGFLEIGAGTLYGVIGGGGGMYSLLLFDGFELSFGGNALAGYLWGDIGEVGSANGDCYLEAPDGERYDVGSKITVSSLTFGLEGLAGLEIDVDREKSLRFDIGYRNTTKVDSWKYNVRDEADDQKSELPASGFESNPISLDLSGMFMRLTFLIEL